MQTPSAHTDPVHDELAARLNASDTLAASGAFRVEKVLKRSDVEETQLVYLRLCDGQELGPYVRKLIDAASGIGGAYPRLARAQRAGARLLQLPRIVGCRERDGRLEVVMEHVPGATLRETVEHEEDRLALAGRLLPAICDAVSELHEHLDEPIVHRDLTPANVIVPAADPLCPVLIDFGIARTWKDGARCDTTHFGTRAYAPPEQFGFGQTDVRSDVYALGMLAFFCLTGRDPEPRDREASFRAPGVPERWRQVICKATALDPQERFASAAELRAAIPGAARDAGAGAEGGAATEAPAATVGDGAARGEDAAERAASPAEAAGAFGGRLLARARLARLSRAKRPARLFTVWNCLVMAATALCCAVSAGLALDEAAMARYPRAFGAFGYAAWSPCGLLLAGYLLLNKRWLRANVAFFRDQTAGQVWKVLLLAYLGVTVVWLALYALGA